VRDSITCRLTPAGAVLPGLDSALTLLG